MKKKSLTIQLVAYFCGMLVSVMLFISAAYYYQSSQLFKNEISTHTIHEMEASAAYISQYLTTLKATTAAVATARDVREFALDNSRLQDDSLQAWLQTLLKTNEHFVSVVLVTKDGRILSNGPVEDMVTSSDMMNQNWYQQAIHETQVPVLSASRLQKNRFVLSVSQEVTDEQGNNLGVIRLDIDYHVLENYLKELSLGEEGYAFIINGNQEIIYHPDSEVFQSSSKQMTASEIAASPMDSVMGADFFVHKTAISNSDWLLVGVTSFSQLQQYSRQLFMMVLVAACISFIFCAIGMGIVVRRWMRPIKKLETTMQQIENGDTTLRVQPTGATEFQQLSGHFNRMLDTIEALMLEAEEQHQAARVYELKALASQINPHFLYNTLDTIIWMAEFNDSEKVVAITQALAQYFRLALNGGEDLIELCQEVEHVRQYLIIQKERYGERLNYTIVIDKNLPEIYLPKLVLQPLVENAIYHGIKESERPGEISLTVRPHLSYIEVIIEDNGVGMQAVPNTHHQLGGVGIRNVQERLTLYFGTAFEMSFDTKIGEYTKVILKIPVEKE